MQGLGLIYDRRHREHLIALDLEEIKEDEGVEGFLAVMGLHCYVRAFSSCTSRDCSSVAACRLPIAVASPISAHRLSGRRLQ